MIVTFKTQRAANITMFGDVALRLLELMGHSKTVPGAIKSEDVPEALARLRAGVEAHGEEAAEKRSKDDDEQRPAINLGQRALPLIELLESAVENEADVMWDS